MFKKLMCFAAIGLIILDTVGEPLSVLATEGIGDDLVNSITIED